ARRRSTCDRPRTRGSSSSFMHLRNTNHPIQTSAVGLSVKNFCYCSTDMFPKPYFVEGDEPEAMHQAMAATLDTVIEEIHAIQNEARSKGSSALPVWPMIILRSPKGWTGPKFVDGKPVERTWRAHQVPVADLALKPEHLKILEEWMKNYRPEELFDESGKLIPELAELAPKGDRRMGANPHANGGLLLKNLVMPDFRAYAVPAP